MEAYPTLNFNTQECLNMVKTLYSSKWEKTLEAPIHNLMDIAAKKKINLLEARKAITSELKNTDDIILILAAHQHLMNCTVINYQYLNEQIVLYKKQMDYLQGYKYCGEFERQQLFVFYYEKIELLEIVKMNLIKDTDVTHALAVDFTENIVRNTLSS